MPVYMLLLEYDGIGFHGWQVQPGLRTVQGELIDKLEKFLKRKFKLIGASRTDSGVHAEGQVASLHTEEEIDSKKLKSYLNGVLSEDLYVKDLMRVRDDFHARFSAISKVYKYRVLKGRSPLRRLRVYEYGMEIDEAKLKEAAGLLIGEKDFTAFAVGDKGGIVKVKRARWTRRGDEFHFIIEADRFLYKMVRALVGLQLRIASGKENMDVLKKALEEGKRPKMHIAPPQGLTLVKVKYPRKYFVRN